MRENGIVSKTKRKFKATTNSKHNLPVVPNLVNQDFDVEGVNRLWVCDIYGSTLTNLNVDNNCVLDTTPTCMSGYYWSS